MKPLLVVIDNNTALANKLLASAVFERGECEVRQFPDGESYVRVISECSGRDIVILCSLYQPDRFVMPLLLCAETLRELNAKSVGLIAPYLAYMRQDIRFHTGEAISSRIFAKLLSAHFDWLVTIDPHLHRYRSLAEIYSIPHSTLSATSLLIDWICKHVNQPLLIGPDSESEQWVAAIARGVEAPYLVLNKTRYGDRDVDIEMFDFSRWKQYTPILIDDIVSTGQTFVKVIGQLCAQGFNAPICAAVHGLFVEDAEKKLQQAGAQRIVTSNTIAHPTNELDVSALLIDAVSKHLI